jgi:hypothetical protein
MASFFEDPIGTILKHFALAVVDRFLVVCSSARRFFISDAKAKGLALRHPMGGQ